MDITVLHPGAMGSEVARTLREQGHRLRWCAAGRSDASAARAAEAGLERAEQLEAAVADAELLISVCPPAAAGEVAQAALAAGFRGLYLDANAIAPATARAIGDGVRAAGGRFVDGSLVGPPPRAAGSTRLYLSGPAAASLAELFRPTRLEPCVLDAGPVAASALKMAYGGWTKASAALLLTVRSLAAAEGVEEALLQEWARSVPGLGERSQRVAEKVTAKAWRYIGEMDQGARACRAQGLPGAFHEAAAESYRRIAPLRDTPPDATTTLDRLRAPADRPQA